MTKKAKAKIQYQKPEQQLDFDFKFFSGLVCMQKVHPLIKKAVSTLDLEQLIDFKKQLLKVSRLQKLPKVLDNFIDDNITRLRNKQDETLYTQDQYPSTKKQDKSD